MVGVRVVASRWTYNERVWFHLFGKWPLAVQDVTHMDISLLVCSPFEGSTAQKKL